MTISAPSSAPHALDNPYGMAFDRSGNLWVVGNSAGKVYEYTRSQLARSGSPTPRTLFRTSRALRLPTALTPPATFGSRFSFLQLALRVVWSSSRGRAGHACTRGQRSRSLRPVAPTLPSHPAGDMWMVTGGGSRTATAPPVTTSCGVHRAEFSMSGSPTPAVTISSTRRQPSLYGRYGVAVDRSGDVWVSNFNTLHLSRVRQVPAFRSGSPTPLRTIAGPNTGMNLPSFVVLAP